MDAITAFRTALQARGIIPPTELIADGKLHRCDVEGRHGKRDGAYRFVLGPIAHGGMQNWKDGLPWQKWRYHGRVSHVAIRSYRQQRDAIQRERRAAQDAAATEAQEKAQRMWKLASRQLTDPAHPYLQAKGVPPYGIGQMGNAIVIPIYDGDGILRSLQFIDAEGQKRFLRGGRTGGGFHVIGPLENASGVIVIAEGYATGASVHMATNYTVVVAFNCGNLLPVALLFREKFPNAKLIIAADDDDQTAGNPGLTKAVEAARHVGGYVVVPKKKGA